jgi:truncated hemoglobin YjbI
MALVDMQELTIAAKAFADLTPEKESCLLEVGEALRPRLCEVTQRFYDTLLKIPKAQPLVEGRVDTLKKTHLKWMEGLFSGPFDENFTAAMYQVGDVHVKVKLPVEFMAGAMTLINQELTHLIFDFYGSEPEKCRTVLGSVNAILGFCLLVMQQSYQSASLAEELERFLHITGMSRILFNNLATAYNK